MRDSQLSQPMKHSRKAITGREVFLGQNGEYTNDQLNHFGLKFFLAALIKDEVNKETVNQLLKPLREYS